MTVFPFRKGDPAEHTPQSIFWDDMEHNAARQFVLSASSISDVAHGISEHMKMFSKVLYPFASNQMRSYLLRKYGFHDMASYNQVFRTAHEKVSKSSMPRLKVYRREIYLVYHSSESNHFWNTL